ncbi:hypothetical protein [Shewanella metallivivens]|uniref:Uncharacterized protein n=1 Tax=Shewanella metallivivens TaxID=2872342 RepID=A0ABT5TLX5_9GAMM|nr:hypothetical protein [Shewanella metallivivens]MDD8059208.1 hypothetical protein [Shewanella metallivivens]
MLTPAEGHLLQKLGHALRLENYSPNAVGDFEVLLAANIDFRMMIRTEIADVADRILNQVGVSEFH